MPKTITDQTTTIAGRQINYKLVQSSLARTVRLKVGITNGLEIIVPRRYRTDHLEHVFKEHQNWILKQLAKLAERQKISSQHQLKNGSTIKIFDEPHQVKIIAPVRIAGKNSLRHPFVKRVQQLIFTNDSAIVEGHSLNIYCDGTITHAKKTLEKYLRKVAEKFFAKRTQEIATQMSLTFNKITVRGQKTRWGSCSRQKNLNFNWRLIMLPVAVAETVIIHELAHTVHMNHSRNFYNLVEKFCPNYRPLQKQLRHPQFPL